LTVNSDGDFIGFDLGDNYPRGINFWTFSESSWSNDLIYAFKTCHATYSNGYDVYTEISTDETTYYKWSNDNNVYTELSAGLG